MMFSIPAVFLRIAIGVSISPLSVMHNVFYHKVIVNYLQNVYIHVCLVPRVVCCVFLGYTQSHRRCIALGGPTQLGKVCSNVHLIDTITVYFQF